MKKIVAIFSIIFLLSCSSSVNLETDTVYTIEDINEDDITISCVTINDAPVISSRKKKKRFKVKKKRFPLNDSPRKNRFRGKNNNAKKQEIDIDDESRFNSEEYHQKQHDL